MKFELLGVVGAARLERGQPAAEAGELIRWQLGNGFGDFFDFHVSSIAPRPGVVERRVVPLPAMVEYAFLTRETRHEFRERSVLLERRSNVTAAVRVTAAGHKRYLVGADSVGTLQLVR